MAAFTLALEHGAAGVELDVRLAKDGVPVVVHDADLVRTGLRPGHISRLTSTELSKTEVGSWFNRLHPELARSEYSGQNIPTLDRVLRLFKHADSASALIYAELKTDQAEDTCAKLCEAVSDLFTRYELAHRVIVVSFALSALKLMKQLNRAITTGALFEPKRSAVKSLTGRALIQTTLACGAEEILLHRLTVTRPLVAKARAANLRPVVWTVDNPQWVRDRLDLGLHAVITNSPASLIRALA